jgi:hypothetical protein
MGDRFIAHDWTDQISIRRHAMKIVCALMLTCTSAVSALAEDSAEKLRERLIICNQFVIEDPYPGIGREFPYCCRTANHTRECHTQKAHEEHR